ncbi:MAG TPA: hypothetical protein VK483_13280 [Chitinophagaceae bacterium]|nr:hypothetical protein [Chitinophagaceae bacterium]
MKKILVFSLLFVSISTAALAQRTRVVSPNVRPNNNQLTWGEKTELRKDAFRYHAMKRKAGRDGRVTPFERRKLRRAKCDTRRDLVRFKHNGRRRII